MKIKIGIESLVLMVSILLLMTGCGQQRVAVQYEENITLVHEGVLATGERATVHIVLNAESEVDGVEGYFSLIPEDQIPTFGTDASETQLNIAPDREYHVGATRLHLKPGTNRCDINVTLPVDMELGAYKLAGYFSDLQSKVAIDFVSGDTIISTDTYRVERKNTLPDLIVNALSLDDDVLLLHPDTHTTFQATVSLQSRFYPSNNVHVHCCLEVDDECHDLKILSPDGQYRDDYTLKTLGSDTINIALHIQIPKVQHRRILNAIQNDIHTANVLVEINQDNNLTELVASENNRKKSALVLYKVDTNLTTVDPLIHFGKTYTLKKMKKRFGTKLVLDSQTAVELEDAYAFSHADLTLRILGKDLNFMHIGIDANFQYDSFDDSGIETSLKFFGMTIQEIKDQYNDIKNSIRDYRNSINNFKEMVKGTRPIPANWHTSLPELKKVHLISIPDDATEALKAKIRSANIKKINIKINSIKSLTKPFSVSKSKSYTEEFLLAVVPVTVEAGAGGEFGYTPSLGLMGISGLDSSIDIHAAIDGFASGGVGIPAYSAGVEAKFSFVEDTFGAHAQFKNFLDGNTTTLYLDSKASLKIDNNITGPNGSLDIYAKYTKPKICAHRIRYCVAWHWNGHCKRYHHKTIHYPCGVTTIEHSKSLFNWESFEVDTPLLDIDKNITQVQIY